MPASARPLELWRVDADHAADQFAFQIAVVTAVRAFAPAEHRDFRHLACIEGDTPRAHLEIDEEMIGRFGVECVVGGAEISRSLDGKPVVIRSALVSPLPADDGLLDRLEKIGRQVENGHVPDSYENRETICAAITALRAKADLPADEEAYQIGLSEGYDRAVQEIDRRTGGDGEYRYCTDRDPYRHTPDAPAMMDRIFERFDVLLAWQTIDSAPKDGTKILAWTNGFEASVAVVYWEKYGADLAAEIGTDGYWSFAESMLADIVGEAPDFNKWMPCPAAPTGEAGQ